MLIVSDKRGIRKMSPHVFFLIVETFFVVGMTKYMMNVEQTSTKRIFWGGLISFVINCGNH